MGYDEHLSTILRKSHPFKTSSTCDSWKCENGEIRAVELLNMLQQLQDQLERTNVSMEFQILGSIFCVCEERVASAKFCRFLFETRIEISIIYILIGIKYE